jgi:translocator protein
MKVSNFLKLLAAIVISELAGIIGSFFNIQSIPTWYATLAKPALNPPNWIFGPVWTTLYLLMGVAAFLVWKKGLEHKEVRVALWIYAVQLVLNTFWSIIFFGFQSPGWALIEISLLWISIVITIIAFHKVSRKAAYLLLPYLAWVSFATYLNYALWSLN